MRIKCDYCGYYIEDTDKFCGVCGAPNDHLMRSADGVPKTIEELKCFCASHRLPLEKMRFFIGVDYKEPKAFGIYKDESGNFIVYKNKADGTRAVRYRGTDEAYAVNEIYQKMKSEIQLRKRAGSPQPTKKKKSPLRESLLILLIYVLIVGFIAFMLAMTSNDPSRGYYRYDDDYYYYQNSTWYYYDDDNGGWDYAYDVDEELTENPKDYFESKSYSSDFGTDDFEDTEYYSVTEDDDWDDDWDDDDWDDGNDWDMGDTDWDTDW